jgi:hypothetical protein
MKEPTEKENLINMQRCPRFNECSTPKCPLDYWVEQRSELPEDKKCVLLKLLGKKRTNRMEGNVSTKMRGLVQFCKGNNSKIAN